MPCGFEVGFELAAGIVDELVERVAVRAHALSQHIHRNALEGDGDQGLVLPFGERFFQRQVDLFHDIIALGYFLRRRRGGGRQLCRYWQEVAIGR